jgi:hypothetical protein
MRDFRDAKTMAKGLRRSLASQGIEYTHSQSLELIAQAFGYDDWNVLAAKIEAARIAPAASKRPGQEDPLHCSFCGKSQHDVRTLIAGPNTFICNECVAICDGVVEDNELTRHLKGEGEAAEGYPALRAYLAERSSEQLAAYLARTEKAVAAERDILEALDGGPSALPGYLASLTGPERARRRAFLAKQLAARQVSLDLVATALAARG